MDTGTISIIIVIIGCIVAVANWVRNNKNDTNQLVSYITQLETKLRHMEEQITDLKIDIKTIQSTAQQAIEEAMIAKQMANALHDRLDTIGVKNAGQCRNSKDDD